MRFASCHLAEDVSLRGEDARQVLVSYELREGRPKAEGMASN